MATNNCQENNAANKLSHKKWKSEIKKQKRKIKRQQLAKEKENIISQPISESEIDIDSENQRIEEEKKRYENLSWLQREREAQQIFKTKKEKEERDRLNREVEEQRIREEFELKLKNEKELKEIEEKRKSELLSKTQIQNVQNETWQNPEPPEGFKEIQDCPFYKKVGACRFGINCSRNHPSSSTSQILLFPGMFASFELEQAYRQEIDSDLTLEFEDSDKYEEFFEFYEEVLPEFESVGEVEEIFVCCNYEPHLRGNVYVQYSSEEKAIKAFQKFNGRWFDKKQLSCQFACIESWKAAICGLFYKRVCPKGRHCNYLHVFKNPFKSSIKHLSKKSHKDFSRYDIRSNHDERSRFHQSDSKRKNHNRRSRSRSSKQNYYNRQDKRSKNRNISKSISKQLDNSNRYERRSNSSKISNNSYNLRYYTKSKYRDRSRSKSDKFHNKTRYDTRSSYGKRSRLKRSKQKNRYVYKSDYWKRTKSRSNKSDESRYDKNIDDGKRYRSISHEYDDRNRHDEKSNHRERSKSNHPDNSINDIRLNNKERLYRYDQKNRYDKNSDNKNICISSSNKSDDNRYDKQFYDGKRSRLRSNEDCNDDRNRYDEKSHHREGSKSNQPGQTLKDIKLNNRKRSASNCSDFHNRSRSNSNHFHNKNRYNTISSNWERSISKRSDHRNRFSKKLDYWNRSRSGSNNFDGKSKCDKKAHYKKRSRSNKSDNNRYDKKIDDVKRSSSISNKADDRNRYFKKINHRERSKSIQPGDNLSDIKLNNKKIFRSIMSDQKNRYGKKSDNMKRCRSRSNKSDDNINDKIIDDGKRSRSRSNEGNINRYDDKSSNRESSISIQSGYTINDRKRSGSNNSDFYQKNEILKHRRLYQQNDFKISRSYKKNTSQNLDRTSLSIHSCNQIVIDSSSIRYSNSYFSLNKEISESYSKLQRSRSKSSDILIKSNPSISRSSSSNSNSKFKFCISKKSKFKQKKLNLCLSRSNSNSNDSDSDISNISLKSITSTRFISSNKKNSSTVHNNHLNFGKKLQKKNKTLGNSIPGFLADSDSNENCNLDYKIEKFQIHTLSDFNSNSRPKSKEKFIESIVQKNSENNKQILKHSNNSYALDSNKIALIINNDNSLKPSIIEIGIDMTESKSNLLSYEIKKPDNFNISSDDSLDIDAYSNYHKRKKKKYKRKKNNKGKKEKHLKPTS